MKPGASKRLFLSQGGKNQLGTMALQGAACPWYSLGFQLWRLGSNSCREAEGQGPELLFFDMKWGFELCQKAEGIVLSGLLVPRDVKCSSGAEQGC